MARSFAPMTCGKAKERSITTADEGQLLLPHFIPVNVIPIGIPVGIALLNVTVL